jgi:sulfur-oxidizing protein SoxZ
VVPLQVSVDSPMSAFDHVTEIGVFNEQAGYEVARFRLGPRNGKADVATRIRLLASQRLMALARMNDGTIWADTAEVVVVPAACSAQPPADAAERAQVQLPGSAISGQLIPVRASIQHGMEARCRPAGDGRAAARDLLRRFTCRYEGETVFGAELSAAIAADPYLLFHLLADRSGSLEFEWQGDQGFRHLERRELKIT